MKHKMMDGMVVLLLTEIDNLEPDLKDPFEEGGFFEGIKKAKIAVECFFDPVDVKDHDMEEFVTKGKVIASELKEKIMEQMETDMFEEFKIGMKLALEETCKVVDEFFEEQIKTEEKILCIGK